MKIAGVEKERQNAKNIKNNAQTKTMLISIPIATAISIVCLLIKKFKIKILFFCCPSCIEDSFVVVLMSCL